jgi:hypothetical protein
MNEEIKHAAPNPELEFEHNDLSPNAVYAFLIGLAVAVVVVYFVLWGLYDFMETYEQKHQPPQNPLVESRKDTAKVLPEDIAKFPQPRLEKNERVEINDFLLGEEQTLDSYGWVDQKAGIVRIPIERAMQLIAQRGLPTTVRVGTVPPSEVNVVNQAAQRADVSNLPGNAAAKQKGQQK